jgi:ribose/xylose/arabinose/galactoside ABC-type transport system permease subunit
MVFSLANAATSLIARIHPIIVTLAGLSIYRGIMVMVTGGSEVLQLPSSYRALANGNLFGLPKICYYVIAVTIVTHIFLRYTIWGRRVLALGNSETAARLIGLSKSRLMLIVFGYSGALVGLTAVLTPGYYGLVQSNTGEGMELKAIAAAVIGGTDILGGRGSALGTLLGAFLVALLYNALILLEASSYWQNIFVGGLILIAVVVDALLQRARGSKA